MGDVISISRISDVDIFSQFDEQCPDIPVELDAHIPENARRALVKKYFRDTERNFRNHCVFVVVLSLVILAAVKLASSVIAQQVGLGDYVPSITATDHRSSQASWLAHIETLESDPAYQRVLEEKRLYDLRYAE